MKLKATTQGILYLVFSAFWFALMAVFVRLAGNIHFMEKAFFRNIVAFFIALTWIIQDCRKIGKKAVEIPKGALKFLICRAIAGTVGIFGNFYAIDRIVLSDATILNKMAPFFTIVFSYLFLREKIDRKPLVFIVIAFLGALLVIKPTFKISTSLPTMAAFAGGVGAGLAYASVRKLKYLNCNANLIVLFFSAFSMFCCIPYLIMNFNPLSLKQFLYLIGAGVCAAGGQFTVTAAYYHAPAGRISIYDYTQVIFSTIFGFIFFSQLPDIYSIAGYIIIISMAICNFVYNSKKANNETDDYPADVTE